jgi:hypothetical protein
LASRTKKFVKAYKGFFRAQEELKKYSFKNFYLCFVLEMLLQVGVEELFELLNDLLSTVLNIGTASCHALFIIHHAYASETFLHVDSTCHMEQWMCRSQTKLMKLVDDMSGDNGPKLDMDMEYLDTAITSNEEPMHELPTNNQTNHRLLVEGNYLP